MERLDLDAAVDNYSIAAGLSVVATAGDGGPSAFRADHIGAVATVSLSWFTDATGYASFKEFVENSINGGADAFLADVMLESRSVVEHTIQILPNSVKVTVQGHAYIIQAQVEVLTGTTDEITIVYGENGLPKLPFDIAQDNYSIGPDNSALAVKLDGGMSKLRFNRSNTINVISVNWYLIAADYSYFCGFYSRAIANGSLPFVVDIFVSTDTVGEHTVAIVPGSMTIASQGDVVIVSAQMEVDFI